MKIERTRLPQAVVEMAAGIAWLFFAMRLFAADAELAPNKPTGPIVPTSEQLIDTATLSKDHAASLMLLHINDVHETLKPPAHGLGGLAYVAGYANQVRTKRPDTIFIDAGDILQKGDAMSKASLGEASYRALGAIGLDCTVPGNHDFNYGLENWLQNIRRVNLPIICAGLTYTDTNEPLLPETMIKQVGDLKIGLIGATVPRGIPGARPVKLMEREQMGAKINELARKLEPQVDLTILVLHMGTWAGKMMAKAAPTLDIVVTGHTNEVTQAPMKGETGALVVGVGRAGQWVGTHDLVVDCDRKQIAKYTYVLVPMDHAKIKPDEKVAQLIDELDKKWTPKGETAGAAADKTGAATGKDEKAGKAKGRRPAAAQP
jgi:2',3'-cyclic-nucleotide 2'-phosphodiesterase (5'-nucleotidase family)